MRIVHASWSAATAADEQAAPTHKATHRRGTEIRRTSPTALCAREAVRRTGIPEFSCTVIGDSALGVWIDLFGLIAFCRLFSFYLSLPSMVNGLVCALCDRAA